MQLIELLRKFNLTSKVGSYIKCYLLNEEFVEYFNANEKRFLELLKRDNIDELNSSWNLDIKTRDNTYLNMVTLGRRFMDKLNEFYDEANPVPVAEVQEVPESGEIPTAEVVNPPVEEIPVVEEIDLSEEETIPLDNDDEYDEEEEVEPSPKKMRYFPVNEEVVIDLTAD